MEDDRAGAKRKDKGITISGNGSSLGSVGSSRPDTPLSTAPSETLQIVAEGGADTQLLALQQSHTAMLADLSNVSAKYRDSLWEIQDLSSQLEAVKLSQDLAASEFPERNGSVDPFAFRIARGKPIRTMSESSGNRCLFSGTRPRQNLSTNPFKESVNIFSYSR